MKTRMNTNSGKYRIAAALLTAFMLMLPALSCKTAEKEASTGSADVKTSAKNKTLKEYTYADISDAEFSGFYKISGDPICRINLTIKKVSGTCSYTFSGDTFTSSGTVTIKTGGGQTRLYFNETKCGGSSDVITGTYAGRVITIHNYSSGNTRYNCFSECDSRTLRFVKN